MTAGSVQRETVVRGILLAALAVVLALPFMFRQKKEPGAVPAGKADRKLVLVSPHWEGIRKEFGPAFSRYTRAKYGHTTELEWLDIGGASDGIKYVKSEFERRPDGIGIDLFFGGGIDPYLELSRKNLLQRAPVAPEILGRIPATFNGIDVYDPDGRWYGACLSGFGIVFNRPVLKRRGLAEPKTWDDLARPEYRTWVGSGDPRSSGSVHMAYEIILQAYGWEHGWATIVAIGGNIRNFSRAASDVPKDTALGEVACGLAIDVYAWRLIAEVGADRIGFCLPEGLTVINPDSMAVLKGAPNAELAARFIEFVLSDEGQKLWVLRKGTEGGPAKFDLGRIPVVPGFAARFPGKATVDFDAFAWKSGFTYDARKGSLRWGILNDLIGAALIDTHAELAEAWRVVSALPPADPRRTELFRPLMPEQEFMALAQGKWNDAEYRSRTRSQWTTEAKTRYRRLAAGR